MIYLYSIFSAENKIQNGKSFPCKQTQDTGIIFAMYVNCKYHLPISSCVFLLSIKNVQMFKGIESLLQTLIF